MHHPLLSVLGGSDSSDDLSEEWDYRAHRYSTDRRQHRHRHSGECENVLVLCYRNRFGDTYQIQYASKKLPINGPFNGAPVPVQPPFKPRASPVQLPFKPRCGLPVFCTTEFLVRAKLKSKAKKTTEKQGSTQKNI